MLNSKAFTTGPPVLVSSGISWDDTGMPSSNLAALLKLPADERAELAMALWDSLTDRERESELELTAEQQAELDRRWADHLVNPESAILWEEVRRKLRDGK
jgi:putative addiction module component (TIGR02574 family)